ncbi:hypothetical protein KORDIASMS9_01846 [Kordia sp. SMS9]|uniref:hypothetical protein n=1 Tax=Kordia sp. SMS9 TaxID=2282170 RepID=UPI000E0D2BC2|nr:hypothetical protein [Kordia sp. SMS9]AXG69621.1 hypothetical protein KORDIASMS9_01846 [Kordia sp. SMS9]
MSNKSDADQNLSSYFNWITFFLERDNRQNLCDNYDLEKQFKYLQYSFNLLERLEWHIRSAGIVARAINRNEFTDLLVHEDDELIGYIKNGIKKRKRVSDEKKIIHFLRYLSHFKDRYVEFDDKEIPFYELNFKSAVDAYLYWKIHNKKSPKDVKGLIFD